MCQFWLSYPRARDPGKPRHLQPTGTHAGAILTPGLPSIAGVLMRAPAALNRGNRFIGQPLENAPTCKPKRGVTLESPPEGKPPRRPVTPK